MGSDADTDLLDLVGDIYDSAIEPAKWPLALERVANLLDSESVAITLNGIHKPGFTMRAQWNIDPALEAAMLEYYKVNPLVSSIYYYGVDEPFSLLSYVSEAELRSTTFYANTIGKYGILDAAVSLLAKSVSQFGSISIQRAEHKVPFGEKDLAIMRRLVPHIRRAAFIGELLEERALERDMLSATLETLRVGIVLTDGTGKIIHANGAASRLIEDGIALHRDVHLLTARHRESARELSQAIATAASGTSVDLSPTGVAVSLRGKERDLVAWILPLDGGLRRDLGAQFTARVAVFLREMGDSSPVPAELFVRRYGITPAECRVLLLIVQGQTAQEAAKALGISLATAKTHISRLLYKTECERQIDLVRLAMSALAPASI